MTRSKALNELIRLGEGSRAYWDRELPKHHPKWPIVQTGEDSGPPPPEEAKILKLLESLPEEDLFLLCLLMYVGRGDFDIDHLKSAYRRIRDSFPSREWAIDQIVGTRDFSEYLMDALQEVQNRKIKLDGPSLVASTVK